MANAECARTREVVKVLEILVSDLKEYPMLGSAELDPRLAVAFEVALFGDDAELSAGQTKTFAALLRGAERRANAEREHLEFRAPLPRFTKR